MIQFIKIRNLFFSIKLIHIANCILYFAFFVSCLGNQIFGQTKCNLIDASIDTIVQFNGVCIDSSIITGLPCTTNYNPVCGCDGNTYSNSCFATESGVNSYSAGVCDSIVTTFGDRCCYALDLDIRGINVVQVQATILTQGVHYGNTMFSFPNLQLSINVLNNILIIDRTLPSYQGLPPGFYNNILKFCLSDITSNLMYPQCIQFDYYELDSLNIPRVICTDTVKLYCPVKKYYCDSFITVDTKSNNVKCFDPSIITGLPCSQLYNPVCGCNGVTYSNACLANEAGIASFTVGKCDTTVFPSISDCCYTLDLNENVFAISGEILTPGVIFSEVMLNPLYSYINLTATTNSLFLTGQPKIGIGASEDFLKLCLSGVTSFTQYPVSIVFHFWRLGPTDIPEILCSDTIKFYCPPCSILTGEAWYDQNGDGIFQQIENGFNGLDIELVDVMTGQVVSTTHTITKPGTASEDGYYEFPCVNPGMYFVRFDSLSGFTTSTPFQGGNAETDSDITGTYGPYTTYKFTVISGDTINNIDGGYKDSTSVNIGHLTIAGLIITETTKAMLPSRVNLATVNNSNYETEWSHYSGNYAFSDLTAGQDYRISVENNESPLQGVSTRDIVLIQKHILGIKYLDSPYKIIAADVNSSQSITASDLAEIRKLILGVIETFPKNKSWRFVPKNYVFKNPAYPFPFEENILHSKMENNKMNTDFYAVKIGDVSGNALGLVNTTIRSVKNVQLIFEKTSYKKNEEISVPVRISEGDMLSGIQIALQLSDELEFVTIEKGSLNINQENYHFNRGKLMISYNEARGFDIGKKDIFTLRFKAKTDLNIDNKIRSSNLLENEAYDLADQVVPLEVISSVENIKTTSGVYKFYPAKPNPFKQETMIEFELPNEEAIIFTVYNPEGKLVWSKEKMYMSGNNQMSISKEDLGHSGLYYLHIQSKEFCKTQRILMLD